MRIYSFFKHIIKNVKIENNQIRHFPDKTRRYLLLCGSGDSINQIKTTSQVPLNSKIIFFTDSVEIQIVHLFQANLCCPQLIYLRNIYDSTCIGSFQQTYPRYSTIKFSTEQTQVHSSKPNRGTIQYSTVHFSRVDSDPDPGPH